MRSAFLCSIVVFVKYRRVPTRTILPSFIDLSGEIALYSRFRGVGKKGKKEEAYVRQVLNCFNSTPLEFPWPTGTIPKGNQNNSPTKPVLAYSHRRSLRLVFTARLSLSQVPQPLLREICGVAWPHSLATALLCQLVRTPEPISGAH